MQNIKNYEAMAKIELTESEREIISARIDGLLSRFKKLNDIDTSTTEPLVSVLDMQNVLRQDINVKMISREELLSAAPEQYDGYFQVPRTLV